jgi:hypothetical protein
MENAILISYNERDKDWHECQRRIIKIIEIKSTGQFGILMRKNGIFEICPSHQI